MKNNTQNRNLFKCERCGWEWFSTIEKPTVCAKCHNPYWNIPKEKRDNSTDINSKQNKS